MPLPIVEIGNPVLRRVARALSSEEIRSPEIQKLIRDMRETMHAAPGVGLAAPQVGHSIQLAVIEDRAQYHKDIAPDQLAAKQRRAVPFHALINPKVIRRSDETREFFEGCLSLPGYTAIVRRAHAVTVAFLDEEGNSRSVEATGWYARILQHEIDHLQGHLYIDRMETRSFSSLDNFSEFWKDLPTDQVLREIKHRESGD
jgi:peptide deformylase